MRALVVDDDYDTAQSFARVLEVLGHEATFCTDARNALSEVVRLKQEMFLDIGMPHLDGYTLATQLRLKFSPNQLKLVAVTAYGQAEDRARS